jgi:hypothetical protein
MPLSCFFKRDNGAGDTYCKKTLGRRPMAEAGALVNWGAAGGSDTNKGVRGFTVSQSDADRQMDDRTSGSQIQQ